MNLVRIVNKLEFDIINNYLEYHEGKKVTNRELINFNLVSRDKVAEVYQRTLGHITDMLTKHLTLKGYDFKIIDYQNNLVEYHAAVKPQTVFTYTIKRQPHEH